MKPVLALLLMVASLAALAQAPAYATGHKDVAAFAAQSIVPVSTAVAAVRRAYPGADVRSYRFVDGENPYYLIRILTPDGHRLDVRVDARSGRVRR